MARTLRSDKVLFWATLLLVGASLVMVFSASAVQAMEKYGTLEKGMELEDLRSYAAGSPLTLAQKHLILRFSDTETAPCVPNNILTLKKGVAIT